MGRCPVRSIFPDALKLLEANQHKLRYSSFRTPTDSSASCKEANPWQLHV